LAAYFRFSLLETKDIFRSTMASSSKKQKSKGKQTTTQGVLEDWFAENEEAINAYIHETSRK